MAGVTIEWASKRYGDLRALDDVSIEVCDGEFLTVLGPSGSGKSTLLRLIAGLETPDGGCISIGDHMVCGDEWVPPQERNVGMVFQNYALWPHMTAAENVAFPLEMRRLSKSAVRDQVQEVLALVELEDLGEKRPGQMSGGEQQRVALARALVGRPAVLLMDECLSNLDARLREKMAGELRRIQSVLKTTTIYVTHDQHEALALSDRIAVLHRGRLQQVGHPHELYRRPRNSLVATALGPINLLAAEEAARLRLRSPACGRAVVGIRPEHVELTMCDAASHPLERDSISGRVIKSTFMGDSQQCWIEAGGCTLHVCISLGSIYLGRVPVQDDEVWLSVDPRDCIWMEDQAE